MLIGNMDVGAGVHMGWITGVVMFPLAAVVLTASAISAKLGTQLLEQIKNTPSADPAMQRQMVEFFQSGAGMAVGLAVWLVFWFLLIIGLSIAGGALGAKLSGRNSS